MALQGGNPLHWNPIEPSRTFSVGLPIIYRSEGIDHRFLERTGIFGIPQRAPVQRVENEAVTATHLSPFMTFSAVGLTAPGREGRKAGCLAPFRPYPSGCRNAVAIVRTGRCFGTGAKRSFSRRQGGFFRVQNGAQNGVIELSYPHPGFFLSCFFLVSLRARALCARLY